MNIIDEPHLSEPNPHLIPRKCIQKDILFGQVHVGTTDHRIYTLKNIYEKPISYVVHRSKDTNPLYHVFNLNKYEALDVPPGGETHFKISFYCSLPHTNHLDDFKILDSNLTVHDLTCKAECVGPLVTCSMKYIDFFLTPDFADRKKIFEIENPSKVPATYQFDINEDVQDVFQIDFTKGIIEPGDHIYVTIKFQPKSPGFYARTLSCLVLYHEPILVHLFGVYTKNIKFDASSIYYKHYPFPVEDTTGYSGYFSDAALLKKVPPPVSFSENYIDFDRILPEATCQTLTTSLTNHLDSDILVEWENYKLFKINPEKLTIPAKKSALYEVKFSPEVTGNLSSVIMQGLVSWSTHSSSFCKPIPINLRMIGHSFPKNELWMPSVTITPETVTLPLTLPNYPSWATFMFSAHGHLPVLFKLLPPEKTNFLMKPMMGLIRGFQIIVVQIHVKAPRERKTSFVEKWNVELNGKEDRLLPIYVKGQTDIPRIVVGENNVVNFEGLQPGSQGQTTVPLKNISTCPLHFQFDLDTQYNIGIFPCSGQLTPNETMQTTWYYTADQILGVKETQVTCELQTIFENGVVAGAPYEVPILVKAYCSYSELCAFPRDMDCGDVEYNSTIRFEFFIYNFGDSIVNFLLSHDHGKDEVLFDPPFAGCPSKDRMVIKVVFKVKKIGKNMLNVLYTNRISPFTTLLSPGSCRIIFSLAYNAIYPVLHIADLIEHDTGPMFTKQDLWSFFKIDEINSALSEAVPGEIRRVNVSAPECEETNQPFYLTFIIKNDTKIGTSVTLKRRQVCDCELKEDRSNPFTRQKVLDCPHKDLFTVTMSCSEIPAKSFQTITFMIRYLIVGKNILSYHLILPYGRTVEINIAIETIPMEQPRLSPYNTECILNLGDDVYIGLRDGPVQGFWLYNNTSAHIPYKLEDLEIVKMCNFEGFPVLKCVNGEGFIAARTAAPVLFRFLPIQVKCYEVSLPLVLGTKAISLTVIGRGSDQVKQFDGNAADTLSVSTCSVSNKYVTLSVDQMVIEPIIVGTYTERLFFIKNDAKSSEIKYKWMPCVIAGLVRIEPQLTEGVLQPKETHSVVLKISALSEPCRIKVSLVCTFYDVAKKKLLDEHKIERSVRKSLRPSMEEFVFTDVVEDKTETPPPEIDLNQLEKDAQIFHIALPIIVHGIGILDKDTCLSLSSQLRQKPFHTVSVDIKKFVKEYFEQTKEDERPIRPQLPEEIITEEKEKFEINKEMTKDVLECLVADAVFSGYFYDVVCELKTETPPQYSQIKFELNAFERERIAEMRNFFTKPQLPELADICKDVVVDSLHEVFRLGPAIKDDIEKKNSG